MASDSIPFVASIVLTLVGMAIILYGVSLNYGESINMPMMAGGVVLLLGIGVLTQWVIAVDEAAGGETEGHA